MEVRLILNSAADSPDEIVLSFGLSWRPEPTANISMSGVIGAAGLHLDRRGELLLSLRTVGVK